MAKTNTIITIGRQFGSAGREIGRIVAKHLDVKLYDKEMLSRAAQESGLCKELFETHDEYDNVLSVFIHADMDARIRRIARIYDLTDAKAKDMIIKTDKKRSSYYNYYSNKRWGDVDSYDMCLNSSMLGIEGTAEAIEKLVELKERQCDKKL